MDDDFVPSDQLRQEGTLFLVVLSPRWCNNGVMGHDLFSSLSSMPP